MSDYQTLLNDVANWIARESLTSVIPTFVRLAEARHRRDLRLQAMMRRARTLGTDTQYLALPDDYLEMRRLRVIGDSEDSVLAQVTPDGLRRRSNGGLPRTFCVHREIEFDAPLGGSDEVEMVYYAPFTPLENPTDTNWLLTNAYDAYLYASLTAAEPYLRNDERIAVWGSGYDGAVAALIADDARGRISSGGQTLSMASVVTP